MTRQAEPPLHALTTSNLIAACGVLVIAFGSGWTLMQSNFANVEKAAETRAETTNEAEALLRKQGYDLGIELKARLELVEAAQAQLRMTAAREPVEKATVEAITSAIDKRIDLIQAQITDINRQIAAALIIIDNNNNGSAGGRKLLPGPQ